MAKMLWVLLSCSVACVLAQEGQDSFGNIKRDPSQTLSSRLKRKSLSVDFAVPSLLRHYMALFSKRPLSEERFAVRAGLRMRCAPLQRTVASLMEGEVGAKGEGVGPEDKRGPEVLHVGLSKASRKSNQVVVEVGEDMVRQGCGGLRATSATFLYMDLTRVMEWWLGAEGGRLRVRLLPERKAQVPGREELYSAAIRASDARLTLHMESAGCFEFAVCLFIVFFPGMFER
ncbi:hypothetical protein SRHO_G00138100 [Serrasalmus rhombeus]